METFATSTQRAWLFWLSVVLYVVSLCLPAFLFESHEPVLGITLLFAGWSGFLFFNFAWLANINFFYGIREFRRRQRRNALISSGVALGLGCFTLMAKDYYFNEGSPDRIWMLGPGFYAWMSAFAALLLSSYLLPASAQEAKSDESDGVA